MFTIPFKHPFRAERKFRKPVAYFSMEFAVDQALKIYSGGLGFLAGSHMRSVFRMKQQVTGIGILWKCGYYDQERNRDNTMRAHFQEKIYHFLEDTHIRFRIKLLGRDAWVQAYYLPPDVFGTAPLFLLTTDTDGNDDELRGVSYQLYDSDPRLKVAQCVLLGIGGARLLDEIQYSPEVYHLNEAHALAAAFYLYGKFGSLEALRQRLVFTTHTPEEAGNEKHDIHFLEQIGFFNGLPMEKVRQLTGITDTLFNHSLAALRLSRKANGVSELHGEVARKMWGGYTGICGITHITNAQNKLYWVDAVLERARLEKNTALLSERKQELKARLFEVVADQTGRIFSPDVLTIVWARRFAAYKRADLLLGDMERFSALLSGKYPVQLIWAGKPYPTDGGAIGVFNYIQNLSHLFPRMAVLTGYELTLSRLLKNGADVWLNTPVVGREASGTSGMTAAMNAALNCSTFDGWIREFARHNENAFLLPVADPQEDVNEADRRNLYALLEKKIVPAYYEHPQRWREMILQSMDDVSVFFDSDRMAAQYYTDLYGKA